MHSFAWWPTLIVLAVATFTDLRSRRIPTGWCFLPVGGIAVSGWMLGWHGIGQSFAGLGLGLLLYGFLFWLGGMGAGDVKLCAAIGAWIGPDQLFFALIVTAMPEASWPLLGSTRRVSSRIVREHGRPRLRLDTAGWTRGLDRAGLDRAGWTGRAGQAGWTRRTCAATRRWFSPTPEAKNEA